MDHLSMGYKIKIDCFIFFFFLLKCKHQLLQLMYMKENIKQESIT